MPAVAFGVQAFYKAGRSCSTSTPTPSTSWATTPSGVPGLYRFCQSTASCFTASSRALKSTSNHAAVRRVMDLLRAAIWRYTAKTPTYAKTPAVAAELESLGVLCAG